MAPQCMHLRRKLSIGCTRRRRLGCKGRRHSSQSCKYHRSRMFGPWDRLMMSRPLQNGVRKYTLATLSVGHRARTILEVKQPMIKTLQSGAGKQLSRATQQKQGVQLTDFKSNMATAQGAQNSREQRSCSSCNVHAVGKLVKKRRSRRGRAPMEGESRVKICRIVSLCRALKAPQECECDRNRIIMNLSLGALIGTAAPRAGRQQRAQRVLQLRIYENKRGRSRALSGQHNINPIHERKYRSWIESSGLEEAATRRAGGERICVFRWQPARQCARRRQA